MQEPSENQADPSLADRVREAAELLESIADNRAVLAELTETERTRLLQAAGQVPSQAVTLDAAGLQDMHGRKTGALIRASAVSGAMAETGER